MKPRLTAPARSRGGSTVRPTLPHTTFTDSTSTSERPNVSSSGSSGTAPVERADEEALDQEAERADDERGQDQREPEALREPETRERDVRAQHVERAVREVDDGHQPEDQAEPDGHEHEDAAEHEPGEDLGGERGERDVGASAHAPLAARRCTTRGPFRRRCGRAPRWPATLPTTSKRPHSPFDLLGRADLEDPEVLEATCCRTPASTACPCSGRTRGSCGARSPRRRSRSTSPARRRARPP